MEPHVDNMHGASWALVLANEGLRFRQGRYAHVTRPGEWFVFNDYFEHEVEDTESSRSYVVWVVPLTALAA